MESLLAVIMTRMSTVEFNCTIPRQTPLPTALLIAIYFSIPLSITYCNFTSCYWGEREEVPHTWRMGAMSVCMSCTSYSNYGPRRRANESSGVVCFPSFVSNDIEWWYSTGPWVPLMIPCGQEWPPCRTTRAHSQSGPSRSYRMWWSLWTLWDWTCWKWASRLTVHAWAQGVSLPVLHPYFRL